MTESNPDPEGAAGSQQPVGQQAGAAQQPQYSAQPQYGQSGQPGQPYAQQAAYGQGGNQPPMGQMPPNYTGGIGSQGEPPMDQPWYGITFRNAVTRFFKKYVDFSGRASKGEFWWAILMVFLGSVIIGFFTLTWGSVRTYLGYAWSLAMLLPTLAVTSRRLHDTNLSGWWTALPAVLTYGGSLLVSMASTNIDQEALLSQDLDRIDFSALMNVGWGALLNFIGLIIWLIFAVRQSKPAGVRFDKGNQAQTIAQ